MRRATDETARALSHRCQVRGDYIRIRNVYVRSTRSYNRGLDAKSMPKGMLKRRQQQEYAAALQQQK